MKKKERMNVNKKPDIEEIKSKLEDDGAFQEFEKLYQQCMEYEGSWIDFPGTTGNVDDDIVQGLRDLAAKLLLQPHLRYCSLDQIRVLRNYIVDKRVEADRKYQHLKYRQEGNKFFRGEGIPFEHHYLARKYTIGRGECIFCKSETICFCFENVIGDMAERICQRCIIGMLRFLAGSMEWEVEVIFNKDPENVRYLKNIIQGEINNKRIVDGVGQHIVKNKETE